MSDIFDKKPSSEVASSNHVLTVQVGSESSPSKNNENGESEEPNHQSKRRRIIHKEIDCKPAPSEENELLPLAPTLQEYLSDGGYLRYLPRPEWCCSANYSHIDAEHYASADSSQPSQPPAPRNRRRAFGPFAQVLGFGDAYENNENGVALASVIRSPGEMQHSSMSYFDLNDYMRRQIVDNTVNLTRMNEYEETNDVYDARETRVMVSVMKRSILFSCSSNSFSNNFYTFLFT